jgi:hypothetical protein
MSNPYQTPAFDPRQFQDRPLAGPVAAYGANWVGHVRSFAVLNAVQGILETFVGIGASVLGVALPAIGKIEGVRQAQGNQGGQSDQMMFFAGIVYLAIGIPVLASGILRIVAGVQNFRFKSRVLGLVSIIVGVAPVFTCYCGPTAIAMLVYGLIIHLDPAVVAAFKMVSEGKTVSQVLAEFDPYQAAFYPPPQPGSPLPPPT